MGSRLTGGAAVPPAVGVGVTSLRAALLPCEPIAESWTHREQFVNRTVTRRLDVLWTAP